MKKKIFLFLAAVFSLFAVNLAHAQQTGKVPRIGFLDQALLLGCAVLMERSGKS